MASLLRTYAINVSRFQVIKSCHSAIPLNRLYSGTSLETNKKEKNTILGDYLKGMIQTTGPIPLYNYMKYCNSAPLLGYYNKDDVIGKKGDFITNPEISQVFGELLALWYVSQWENSGYPDKIRIVELGPGKGTLMEDMMRTFKTFGKFYNSIHSVISLEASENLARMQAEKWITGFNATHLPPIVKLNDALKKPVINKGLIDGDEIIDSDSGIKFKWTTEAESLGDADMYTIVLAHEFFDALGVRQFKKVETGWHEIMVDINSDENSSQNFSFHLSQNPIPLPLLNEFSNGTDLTMFNEFEYTPDLQPIIKQVKKLLEGGGSLLVVDYGSRDTNSFTLRGIRNHAFIHPLSYPGLTDLSVDVNFGKIIEYLKPYQSYFTTQGQFLSKMGIEARLNTILNHNINKLNSDPKLNIEMRKIELKKVINTLKLDYDRLVQGEMGSVFKVLGVAHSTLNDKKMVGFEI